jgi:hypothetical protein
MLQRPSASPGPGLTPSSLAAASGSASSLLPTAAETAAGVTPSGITGFTQAPVGSNPGKQLGLRTAHIIVDANGEYREGLNSLREAAAANQREVDAFRASKEALGLGKDGRESASEMGRLQSQLMLGALGSATSGRSRGLGL